MDNRLCNKFNAEAYKKMTPFKKLAEKIEAKPRDTWFCCNDLGDSDAVTFFEKFFIPTDLEGNVYGNETRHVPGLSTPWMCTKRKDRRTLDNEDRITALLFADQLWQDKENRKYERK